MIGRMLGKLVALPIHIAAIPLRVIDHAAGAAHDGTPTPGKMVKELANAVDAAVAESLGDRR